MTDNTELNVIAFAEAIYKKQCDYVGPDHEGYCVGELKTVLQSMEDKISALQKRDRVVGDIAEGRRKEVVKLRELTDRQIKRTGKLTGQVDALLKQVKEYEKALTEARYAADGGDGAHFNLLRIKAMNDSRSTPSGK